MKVYIKASEDKVRLSPAGGNRYITTYRVFYGENFSNDKWIGNLDEHDTYYVAWYCKGKISNPNAKWETKNFDDKDSAVAWIVDKYTGSNVTASTDTDGYLNLDEIERMVESAVGSPVMPLVTKLYEYGFREMTYGDEDKNTAYVEYATDGENPGSYWVKLYYELERDKRNSRRWIAGNLLDYTVDRFV